MNMPAEEEGSISRQDDGVNEALVCRIEPELCEEDEKEGAGDGEAMTRFDLR